jgi:hypothetical protein
LSSHASAIVVPRRGCANFMAYEVEALKLIAERGGF